MQQIQSVLALIVAAWVLGAVFDVYNTVTGASKWLRWIRPVLDVVFWIAAAAAVFFVMFTTDDGRLRIYTFLILAVGYVLYRVFFHHRVVHSAFRVVRIVGAALRSVARVVYATLIWPLWMLLRIVTATLRQLYRLMCRLEDVLFSALAFLLKLSMFLTRWKSGPVTSLREKIDRRMEGIWEWASNTIRRASNRT